MRTSKKQKALGLHAQSKGCPIRSDMQMSMIERDVASWNLPQGFLLLASLSSGQGVVERNTSGWKQDAPFLSRLTKLGPL